MPLTNEDFKIIEERFDDKYVHIRNCNETQKSISEKINNNDKRIELILAEIRANRDEYHRGQKFNNWLTFAVLGTIIAGIIGFYFMNFGG